MKLTGKAKTELRKLVAEACGGRRQCDVGLRDDVGGKLTENSLRWAEDVDLGDIFDIKSLKEVEAGLVELDIYAYTYGPNGELDTNVAVWLRDGVPFEAMESVSGLGAVNKRREELVAESQA